MFSLVLPERLLRRFSPLTRDGDGEGVSLVKFYELWRDERKTDPEADRWLLNTLAYGTRYASVRTEWAGGRRVYIGVDNVEPDVCSNV